LPFAIEEFAGRTDSRGGTWWAKFSAARETLSM
jgi:hypothetical protein